MGIVVVTFNYRVGPYGFLSGGGGGGRDSTKWKYEQRPEKPDQSPEVGSETYTQD